MKRLIGTLRCIRRLAAVGLLFSGSLLAAESAWITATEPACPLFRKEFMLPASPSKAIVRMVGLGHFQLQVNGHRTGDAAIRQPWSQYDKTIYFEEIDVTPLLRKGTNVLGVLGNSFWFNPPSPPERYNKDGAETDFGTPFLLWLDADIETADGSHTRVASDESWKTAVGPVTFSHVYGGEDFDARLEPAGWDSPGFDDRNWTAATVEAPPGKLEKQFWPPIREKEVFPAKDVTAAESGVFHAFFAQNASAFSASPSKGGPARASPCSLRSIAPTTASS